MRNLILPAAIALPVLLAAAQPAEARAPVNEWFCKVLKAPFDPKAAIAAFPLEKLPEPVETRDERTDDDGDKTTWVELKAEGEQYEVSYRYAFNHDDVTDPFGFHLRVGAAYDISDAVQPEMDKWLAEFGTPERATMGRAVYAGPKTEILEEPFSFERWRSSAVYTANWQSRSDLKYAADLCSKK